MEADEDFSDILEKDINQDMIHGTAWVHKEASPNKALLFVHGISMNRHAFSLLAKKFAKLGYFCLSIDLPGHFGNETKLRMGLISRTILAAIDYLTVQGFREFGVISHSLGAVGSLFSAVGYTEELEQRAYVLGNDLLKSIEEEARLLAQYQESQDLGLKEEIKRKAEEITHRYTELKQLVLAQLQRGGVRQKIRVHCFVFIAPPENVKKSLPGLKIISKLPESWIKALFNNVFHKASVKRAKKVDVAWDDKLFDKDSANWLFLKVPEVEVFLKYFFQLKEPLDYIQLIELLAKVDRSGEGKKTLFSYYYEKYLLSRPKLFVYGKGDLFLRPFTRRSKTRIEKFYTSCGNAEIYTGVFNHIVSGGNVFNRLNPGVTPVLVTNEDVAAKVVDFIKNNV